MEVELEEVDERLTVFTAKITEEDTMSSIADNDLVFLRKEINRNKAAIQTSQEMQSETLAEAMNVKEMVDRRPDGEMLPSDIQALKQALRSLTRQDEVDLPRIRKNLDQLEGFTLKALKN